MRAVLSNTSIEPSDMHAHQFHDLLMLQARLLREGKVAEADLVHIAQELEEMGNEIESALVSYFRQTLVRLCKIRYSSRMEPNNPWRAEISNFRSEIDERAFNRFTNPSKIEEPREPPSGAVRTTTITRSHICPLEMKVFWPDITNSSPSRTARVRMP